MLAKTIDGMCADPITAAPMRVARAAIAATMLGDEPAQLRVGNIVLHQHQRSAVARIQTTLAERGGALLCDDVGLGKTYVALAIAATHEAVTIVAPAALADMWRHALNVTQVHAEFISLESLGRGSAMERRRSLIIVDEAHHFRNPCTRRYSALARMCMITPVLLISATPLHNSRNDVAAIVALFAGSGAYAMSDAELAPMIVRRDVAAGIGAMQHIPLVEHAARRIVITHEELLDVILALPAPVPPSDGSVATRLVAHGLARQWVSSNAALVGALKRRIGRSHGLVASLEAGRYPTATELSAWVYTGDAVQLAFAELLLPATAPLVALTAALGKHVAALNALLSIARTFDDGPLVDYVREIRVAHPGEKIVAFSCYAETADAIYRALRPDGHVALLTARGAMIASGPISRAEILEQFAARVTTTHDDSQHGDVRLLVATDLISEGVNLQCASVVIHLDLPWTAARVDQRIGRLARLGSPHSRVVSYAVNPPPRAEQFLHELEIVYHKSQLAAHMLGASPISDVHGLGHERAPVARRENSRHILESWRDDDAKPDPGDAQPIVARVTAPHRGALGAWRVDGAPILLAWSEAGGITTDPADLESAITLANVASDTVGAIDISVVSSIFRAVYSWYEQRRAWQAVGGSESFLSNPHTRDIRRSVARVADATSANAGFARRSESAATAARLRTAAMGPLPLAVEWSLETLSECADDASVNTILDLVERARPVADHVRESGVRCIAMILFTPENIRTK